MVNVPPSASIQGLLDRASSGPVDVSIDHIRTEADITPALRHFSPDIQVILLLYQSFCHFHEQLTSDEIDDKFPKKLPTKVANAFASKKPNANDKNSLISICVTRFHQDGVATNRNLKKMASRMQKKWSPMKNPLVPGDTVRFPHPPNFKILYPVCVHFL